MRRFTLLELLIIMAIIGLLFSLLLPGLQKTRDASRASVCLSNEKQIGIAMTMYAVSNANAFVYGLPMSAKDLGTTMPLDSKPPMEMLFNLVSNSYEVFICPLDPSPEDYNFWRFQDRPNFSGTNARASYMFNEFGEWYYPRDMSRAMMFSDLANPSSWPMASDGTVVASSPQWTRCNPANSAQWGALDWWHSNSKVAMLFGNGHVENISALTAEQYAADPDQN
ncbi:MAG: hypothetical protein MK132_19305 [Lentisphaerales bacterium]|nr:hypothetical protein [Lentisphaerales bacterium]